MEATIISLQEKLYSLVDPCITKTEKLPTVEFIISMVTNQCPISFPIMNTIKNFVQSIINEASPDCTQSTPQYPFE